MCKLKTNTEITFAIIKDLDGTFKFAEIVYGFDRLHILYLSEDHDEVIQQFEELTNRNYIIGHIPGSKLNVDMGIILLQEGFRHIDVSNLKH